MTAAEDVLCSINGTEFRLTIDAVILIGNKVVLMKRATEPFRGKWVLPGGIVGINERLEDAVRREVREETGIDVRVEKLVGVYDALGRDPRGRSVSIAYLCSAEKLVATSTEEALEIKTFAFDELPAMGFDHEQIVRDCQRLL